MDDRPSDRAAELRSLSLAWRCAGCGFYQLFDVPAPQPDFCKLCGSRGMLTAGLGEPAAPPRGPR